MTWYEFIGSVLPGYFGCLLFKTKNEMKCCFVLPWSLSELDVYGLEKCHLIHSSTLSTVNPLLSPFCNFLYLSFQNFYSSLHTIIWAKLNKLAVSIKPLPKMRVGGGEVNRGFTATKNGFIKTICMLAGTFLSSSIFIHSFVPCFSLSLFLFFSFFQFFSHSFCFFD